MNINIRDLDVIFFNLCLSIERFNWEVREHVWLIVQIKEWAHNSITHDFVAISNLIDNQWRPECLGVHISGWVQNAVTFRFGIYGSSWLKDDGLHVAGHILKLVLVEALQVSLD